MMDINTIKDLVIEAVNREEDENHDVRINPPINMIDSFIDTKDGGYDIHCSNGYNFRLGSDGYLYNIGYDT